LCSSLEATYSSVCVNCAANFVVKKNNQFYVTEFHHPEINKIKYFLINDFWGNKRNTATSVLYDTDKILFANTIVPVFFLMAQLFLQWCLSDVVILIKQR